MKKLFKIILGVLFLLVLLGTFAFLWNKTRPVKVVYEIVEPVIDTLERRAVATGKVEPRDEVLIKPQISGIISHVYKEAGEMIKKGEIIAKVNVIPEMGQLNSAESRLNVARINLDQTTREHRRVEELFENGVVSREEYDKAQSGLKLAREEVQNAVNNLEIVRNGVSSNKQELSNTQIRSTIDGMILDVPVKVGNSVIQSNTFNDGTTIASVADMNDMIFHGNVDETEVGRLSEGMPVKLSVGALQDITLEARLEYIAPKGVLDNGVVMFEIKAAADIPRDMFIRAGYSANADIVIDRREGVLTVPESTVEFEGDKTYVQVLTSAENASEQTFDRREVTLGLSDGVKVEIREGLTTEDRVRGGEKNKK